MAVGLDVHLNVLKSEVDSSNQTVRVFKIFSMAFHHIEQLHNLYSNSLMDRNGGYETPDDFHQNGKETHYPGNTQNNDAQHKAHLVFLIDKAFSLHK